MTERTIEDLGGSSSLSISTINSGDPELLAPFEAWGFIRGMQPAADLPARPMGAFRGFSLDAFSTKPQNPVARSPPQLAGHAPGAVPAFNGK